MILNQKERTKRVSGRALEYEAVVRKEDGSLGGQQGRTSHRARGFLSAVCYKVHPHAVHHELFAGEQRWSQELGLESERQEEKKKQGKQRQFISCLSCLNMK